MGENRIQVDYEALEQVGQRFARHAEATHALARKLTRLVQRVGPGVWQGKAAERFIAEMEGEVLPALRRLGEALEVSTKTTQEIARHFHEAEREAAALFALGGGGATTATPPSVATPIVESYERVDEIEQLRGQLASASGLERLRLQLQIAALDAAVARDGATAQTLLDELAAATTEEEREAIRVRLRDDLALMEGLAATLPADEFRSALTALHVNQAGSVAHSDAATADVLIRAGLADYVDESNQVQGNVAIVDDAAWEAATADMGPNVQGANAFVDSNGNIIIHQDRGNPGTIIHEGVHRYSHDAVRTTVSWDLNEGITEYFSRQVIADLPNGATIVAVRARSGIYNDQHAVVTSLVSLVGEETVAGAYFDGETTALRDAYIRASGRTEADWNAFLGHMNSEPPNWTDAQALLVPIPRPTPQPVPTPLPSPMPSSTPHPPSVANP